MFWNQQLHTVDVNNLFAISQFFNIKVAALNTKHKTQLLWHPLFVRWCLNISRVSPKTDNILRESGVQLPTRPTLNDYTHWISAKPGFQNDIDDLFASEAKVNQLEDWQRYKYMVHLSLYMINALKVCYNCI